MVELLPSGWQYPEIASARITFDGRVFATDGFRDCPMIQSADIVLSGRPRGRIEVAYSEEKPPADEGPFLKEKRNLINEVARQIGLILERRVVMTDGDIMDVPDLPSLLRPAAHREAGKQRTLADFEGEYIKNVLASVDGNKSRAAEILGIDRKTLRKRLRQSPTGSD